MPQPLEDISALTIGMWPMATLYNNRVQADEPGERAEAPKHWNSMPRSRPPAPVGRCQWLDLE